MRGVIIKLKNIFILLLIAMISIFSACQGDINHEENIATSKHIDTEEKFDTTNDCSNISENYNSQVFESKITINIVGDVVKFGKYEQDNNIDNGKEEIEWICIKKEDDKALLISKLCLDGQPYNKDFIEIDWENSSLRNWLNTIFYEEAFSDGEQSIILTTETLNSGGNNTIDKVSLLSVDEVNEYFNITDERIANLTDYAVAEVERNATHRFSDGWSNGWWLRSMGEKFDDCAAHVGENGCVISRLGANVDISQGVRPIIWINLK